MDRESLEALLKDLKKGKVSVQEVLEKMRSLPYEDIGFAKPDTHRSLRRMFPEVVYCPGKTNDQIVEVLESLSKHSRIVLATRADRGTYRAVKVGLKGTAVKYHEKARIITVGTSPRKPRGHVLIVTGGTSDIPVAEEAAVTAAAMGCRVGRLYDVGVAGVHRILDNKGRLKAADVLVVVAGMEGALPSVVSGLVDKPVIAVPTSIGYGASFNGLAALLAMMSSCSPGVAVVNIDNGFGAGYMAASIIRASGSR